MKQTPTVSQDGVFDEVVDALADVVVAEVLRRRRERAEREERVETPA